MNRYRVLWIDAAGEGRFTTVDAKDLAHAAWKVATSTESTIAELEDVQLVKDDQ